MAAEKARITSQGKREQYLTSLKYHLSKVMAITNGGSQEEKMIKGRICSLNLRKEQHTEVFSNVLCNMKLGYSRA